MKFLNIILIIFLFFGRTAINIPKSSKIYVAGHNGLAGSALVEELKKQGFSNIVTRSSTELDLRDESQVNHFFEHEQPEYVFHAAGKVGGIFANIASPAEFIYDNLKIAANVIKAAHTYNVKKLLYLGSSCIYPRECQHPMREEYLMTGLCEPTNEYYAIAKIAGIKLCQAFNKQYGTNFITCIPCNLYGPRDHFESVKSHVISSLFTKIHDAKVNNKPSVVISGTGKARREFLFVEDFAAACVFLMENYESSEIINVGFGTDITIFNLAHAIKEIVNYEGQLVFDSTKPDGMPQKLMDITKMKLLGWEPNMQLYEGLQKTYHWYLAQKKDSAC